MDQSLERFYELRKIISMDFAFIFHPTTCISLTPWQSVSWFILSDSARFCFTSTLIWSILSNAVIYSNFNAPSQSGVLFMFRSL